MALDAGDARQGTGLAGLMAEKMKTIEKKFDVRVGYVMLDAMAQAIVEHIQNNAEVSTTTTGTASGVTTGVDDAGTSGTGTGTIA